MDPTDLLFTNSFVATNEIEFNKDHFSQDRINALKTIDKPFPKNYNRNWEPIISNEVRDIVKDRYQKIKRTALCLDSRDRNPLVYKTPNNYKLVLGHQFNNVSSLKLIDINLDNLFLTKTKISWQVSNNDVVSMYSTEINCGLYNTCQLEEVLSDCMSSVPTEDGKIQNVDVKIDPITNEISMVNRCQKADIVTAQTIRFASDDIYFSISPIVFPVNTGIYITVKNQFTNASLPLVVTGLSDIGEYSSKLFNCQEFLLNDTTRNEYRFNDSFNIGGITYYRYLLIPRVNGQTLEFNTPTNIAYSQGIVKYLDTVPRYDYNLEDEINPIIGEAKEMAIDFNDSSIMEIFGWKECEINFGYILSNKSTNNISKEKYFNVYKDYCCKYVFNIEPYILLRLTIPSYAGDKIAGNIVKSQNLPNLLANKDTNVSDIFAKITLGLNNKINTSILQFIDTPLEKLDEIIITFLDRNGEVLDLKCDHTLTLEVTESVDVLKDTLIDSRHGEANITGIRRH